MFEENQVKLHVPMKDVCIVCHNLREKADQSSEEEACFLEHLNEKDAVRVVRAAAMDLQRPGEPVVYLNFDMQSVRQLPLSSKSIFFYKRKLNVYNFTVLQPISNYVSCHIWHEGIGK